MNERISRRFAQGFFKPLFAGLTAGLLCLTALAPAQDAAELLRQSGIEGGLVVHLGCGDGALTTALRASDRYFVHGLDIDVKQVAAARKALIERGVYGPVSIDRWDGDKLPYADNLVSLIVAEEPEKVSEKELLRALAPNGVALVKKSGKWQKTVKAWPKEMDEWTHYLHGPDGNPVGQDTLVGPPARLQWVGSPRWARHHDHAASMSALVSAQGRLFYIFDEGPTASIQLPSQWRLIARDAFNGVILWKRDIERWNTRQYPLKSGPAHLLRRLVAVGERVYVTLGIDEPVTALDAVSGETALTFKGSEFAREIVVADGVAFCVADAAPSKLPDWRREDTYVWANARRANTDWGWNLTQRKILAYNTASGDLLWEAAAPVAPCSLAADAKHIVFHDGKKLVCLDRAKGTTLWESDETPTALPVQTNTGPRVLIYKDAVLFAGNNGMMSGWSLADGKQIWEQNKKPSGHQSLQDLHVIDGLVWTGSIAASEADGAYAGYDALTGKLAKEFPADVDVNWFHHRCYPAKATGKYLLTARNGTEFIDLTAQSWKPHHWVRGGCIYGVMPCNGLLYAPMDSCGCQLEAKLTGLKALAPGPLPQPSKSELSAKARLEKGPAYNKIPNPQSAIPNQKDWPTFRHDAGRSGAGSATVSAKLKQAWRTKLGGRLSAPTVAAGKMFVASIDTHTVHALDAGAGRKLWSFTTGGRIDSPPTYYQGLALFGSADGSVYAVRATDGVLAWRFRAAPLDRRMMAWEQLESAWPVHGSVLIHDGVLYCTAGRNMYVEGGLRFLRLDPATGNLLGETVMDDKDPETGKDMHLVYVKKQPGNNMPVAHSDVLSCDGRSIWMRSQKISLEGKRLEIAVKPVDEQDPEDFHLFCQNGFLDDSYFFRSFWTFGRRVGGGYGAWLTAGRYVPAGRILCFDDERVYGYGRKPEYMTNSSVVEYQMFAADKSVTREAIDAISKADREMNSRSNQKNASSSDWLVRHFFPIEDLTAARYQWTLSHPGVVARAMAVTADTLFVAGPPDLLDERQAYREPDNAKVLALLKSQAEALDGAQGAELWAFNKADGKLAARYAMDQLPVFDGMAAAGSSLYLTTTDGQVIALAGTGAAPLKTIDDRPLQIAWDQPEDPSYLKAPVVRKEGDFAKVAKCQVSESELGYRLKGSPKKQVGLALLKLDKPITGSATFTTTMKAVTSGSGALSNGYLAFGDGAFDANLIKCGARLKTPRASIVQGPLLKGEGKGAKIEAPGKQGLQIVVKVDLKTGKIVYTANGVKLEAQLERPLKSITHVGYAIESALIDFAPIEIETP